MGDLSIIINSLGPQNEEIEDSELEDIEEEIDSISEDKYFTLAKIAIHHGKPQVLEYLFNIYRFNNDEVKKLIEEVQRYKNFQQSEVEDTDDEDEIQEILDLYTKIIKNYCKLPYKKNRRI